MSTSTADDGDPDADQKQSLQVDLREVSADPSLQDVCEWLHACPRVVLPALNQAAKEAVLQHYTMYVDTHSKILVRCEAIGNGVIILTSGKLFRKSVQ